jgi:Mn2+/Fe2+ NRAMP family transporter
LDERFHNAISFYTVFIAATVVGATLDGLNVDPIKALFWSAVVNGMLAPFLLVAISAVASDRVIMRGQISSLPTRLVVAATTVLMFAAGLGMFIF